jgi:RNA polymerase sigma-70 factor, ECF subfamily
MTNWDAIVADDGPMVWRTLWRLLANRADVEECFQETFVAALKLSRRESIESWPALLCRLATARGMDRLRRRYRKVDRLAIPADDQCQTDRSQNNAAATHADPAALAIAAELSNRLREALAKLPERQAELFYLHALCGWSHCELGERMRMTENAVGVAIHRARQRLQELLRNNR